MRTEKDINGEVLINEDIYYGLHTKRYIENFAVSDVKINPHLIRAYLQVKKAAAETNYKCGLLFKEKYEAIDDAIKILTNDINDVLLKKQNDIFNKIVVDAYQGGSGTYLNLNINEVIANTALKISEKDLGDYDSIHPLDDINMSQSTNDTFSTSVKIAVIHLIHELIPSYRHLHSELLAKENEFMHILKLGRIQLQDAVPISLGQVFGAYAGAIERNITELEGLEKKLCQINLGGTAVGNSIAVSREYVKQVIPILQKVTGLNLVPAANMIDNTQNLDVFVEVSGVLKTSAVNLIKMANDLRLLASGPMGGLGEIKLPEFYSASSFIPGKSNPAVLENIIQIAELIKGHDVTISNLAAAGNMELNSFLPMISHLLLTSLGLLKNSTKSLAENCIKLIEANEEKCRENLLRTSAIAASLVNRFGFETVTEIVQFANSRNIPFLKALLKSKLVDENELFQIISSELSIDLGE